MKACMLYAVEFDCYDANGTRYCSRYWLDEEEKAEPNAWRG